MPKILISKIIREQIKWFTYTYYYGTNVTNLRKQEGLLEVCVLQETYLA